MGTRYWWGSILLALDMGELQIHWHWLLMQIHGDWLMMKYKCTAADHFQVGVVFICTSRNGILFETATKDVYCIRVTQLAKDVFPCWFHFYFCTHSLPCWYTVESVMTLYICCLLQWTMLSANWNPTDRSLMLCSLLWNIAIMQLKNCCKYKITSYWAGITDNL